MTTNEPEIARPVLVGDTADIYLHRTLTILRLESINPTVVMEISPGEDCVFAGIGEVVPLLSRVLPETGREVWSLPEGSAVEAGEVCLRIRAPYAAFGLYETAVAGTLASGSGWATAARACVEAAQGIPVVSFGARRVHPSVSGIMDYSAVVGGCVSCSSLLGATPGRSDSIWRHAPRLRVAGGRHREGDHVVRPAHASRSAQGGACRYVQGRGRRVHRRGPVRCGNDCAVCSWTRLPSGEV